MQFLFHLPFAILALIAATSTTMAETAELDLTVTYRERIALPPNAELDLQLIDISRADVSHTRIAAQRVPMASVPMRVLLPYSRQIIDTAGVYVVVADIWSGNTLLFRTTERYAVLDGSGEGPVELVLTIVDSDHVQTVEPLRIIGVEWVVAEVFGQSWDKDDPATLSIDQEMNLAVFGGCNRFVGEVTLSGVGIAFPENLAGTLMACPPEIETQERRFLDALRAVTGYVRYGAGLVLMNANGNALLHLVPRPE